MEIPLNIQIVAQKACETYKLIPSGLSMGAFDKSYREIIGKATDEEVKALATRAAEIANYYEDVDVTMSYNYFLGLFQNARLEIQNETKHSLN